MPVVAMEMLTRFACGVVDGIERGAGNPVVVPVHPKMCAEKISDCARLDGLPHIAKMGRPSAILVHSKLSIILSCKSY